MRGDNLVKRSPLKTKQWLNLSDLSDRLGQDPELIHEMIQCFVESAPELMAQIYPAIAQKNPELLQASLHAYKGVTANLSAEALTEQLQFWEKHLKTHEQLDWSALEEAVSGIQHCHEETLSFLAGLISE